MVMKFIPLPLVSKHIATYQTWVLLWRYLLLLAHENMCPMTDSILTILDNQSSHRQVLISGDFLWKA